MAKHSDLIIVDYQMGNLRSVQKAFEKVGCSAEISSDAETILAARRLVLPGVGAFGDAVHELHTRGLFSVVKAYAHSGRPLMGICLGMQLLLSSSSEFGQHEGLDLIPGVVEPFQLPPHLKVPHIGWNLSRVPTSFAERETHPVFSPLVEHPQHFYYVHSFVCRPQDPSCIALEADYGVGFAGALAWKNIIATQFHPEKSQTDVLALLQRFTQWQPTHDLLCQP